MKTLKLAKYTLVAFMAMQLVSCDNKENADPLFDKTPTERINARESELKTLLNNSEFGWKAVYFTDDTKYGGFTFLFKFNQDMTVDMASDLRDVYTQEEAPAIEAKKITSQYDLQLGSTMSLVFTTKNKIHLLSDSNISPVVKGKGLEGDFQFLYYGQDKGDLVFKTNRKLKELRFVKATKQDWDDIEKNITMRANLENREELFQAFETNDGIATHQLEFSFDPTTRFASPYSSDPAYEKSYSMAIQYTTTGFQIVPAIEIANQKLSNFKIDEVTGNFIATGTNNVSATVKFQNAPFTFTDDYKLLLPPTANVVYGSDRSFLYTASTNSNLYISLVQDIEATLPAGSFLLRVQPWFKTPNGSYVEYRIINSAGVISRTYHFFTLTTDPSKGTITLNPTTVWKNGATFASAVPITAPAFLKNMDNQLMNPQGLYFKKETFKVGGSNTVFTFTSAAAPFRMTTWAFQ
jgi:hypothetical protein